MSFVHHIGEQNGCGCIIEDDENQDGRTQKHIMLKPKPMLTMLMQACLK
jgi:hypothetical protein